MKTSLDTPVAFFIFNRPEVTARVFEQIREARPRRLFVIADGPRQNRIGEAEKCAVTRSIVEKIDWSCDVQRNFADMNMGCGRRVSSGISWVFEQVERAIILEDDCLPHQSFFVYCNELLGRYCENERIMHIGGVNFQGGRRWGKASYFFSKIVHVWGWATWRRAWRYYDFQMTKLNDYIESRGLARQCRDSLEREYWQAHFERTRRGEVDTWDYQWLFSCWQRQGLAIYPNANLVSNIGFGVDATHTMGASPQMNLPTEDIGAITHPTRVTVNSRADKYSFNYAFGGKIMREKRSLSRRIVRRISGKFTELISQ